MVIVLKKKNFFISLLIIVTSLFFVAGYYLYKKNQNIQYVKQIQPHELDIVYGSDSAQLTVYLYFRYDCVYCRKFFTDAFPPLKKEFIDRGKVKLVVKLVNLTNEEPIQNSLKTIVCIHRFGNSEPLHQLLLIEPQVVYTPEFENTTQEFVEKDEFVAECMLSGLADNYLLGNKLEFNRIKLTGTPTFVINNHIYKGFKAYDSFKIVIEKELSTVLR